MDNSLDYDVLIQEELDEWRKMGIADPASVITCNQFFESIKQLAIKNVLVEKGIITQDEIETEFKKVMLQNLKEAREGVTKARMAEITNGLFN